MKTKDVILAGGVVLAIIWSTVALLLRPAHAPEHPAPDPDPLSGLHERHDVRALSGLHERHDVRALSGLHERHDVRALSPC